MNNEWEVERILGHKRVKGKLMFHLKWFGYSAGTWEPIENLNGCYALLLSYCKKHNLELPKEKKIKKKRKSSRTHSPKKKPKKISKKKEKTSEVTPQITNNKQEEAEKVSLTDFQEKESENQNMEEHVPKKKQKKEDEEKPTDTSLSKQDTQPLQIQTITTLSTLPSLPFNPPILSQSHHINSFLPPSESSVSTPLISEKDQQNNNLEPTQLISQEGEKSNNSEPTQLISQEGEKNYNSEPTQLIRQEGQTISQVQENKNNSEPTQNICREESTLPFSFSSHSPETPVITHPWQSFPASLEPQVISQPQSVSQPSLLEELLDDKWNLTSAM